MQSSGGTIPARLAAEEPVRTMLSGPAGGVMGAYQMARLAGFDRIIGFDMGGTSTDVCLVDAEQGGPQLTSEAVISDVPIGIPMLDIHTAGRGWRVAGPLRCRGHASCGTGVRRGVSRTYLLWPRRTGNRDGCQSDPRPA